MAQSRIELPDVTLQATQGIRVIIPPAGLTDEGRMAVLAGTIASLHTRPRNHLQAVELVYNILLLSLKNTTGMMRNFQSLTRLPVNPTEEDLQRWIGAEEGEVTEQGKNLPTLPGPVPEGAIGVTRQEAVYVAVASLLYSLGKQASEAAHTAMIQNRPTALINRFHIQEEDQILLPGRVAGPSRESLEIIYQAFSNYTEVRFHIVSYFLAVNKAAHHLPLPLEVLMTNFNLMRGAGMTHVDAIIKLIRAHPWTLRVPELQPLYHKFTIDLEKFHQVEEDIRPYHRLLVPQGSYLFLSSELRPLIAVAGSFLEEVEATFNGYVYNKNTYAGLIEKVRSYLPSYQPTSGISALAKMLNVNEEPLPSRLTVEQAQGEDEVV